MPSAVVLAIDGLGAKHLGPYGNTWIETPAYNRLATESLLIDRLYAPSTNREETYESWWHHSTGNLIAELNARDIHTHLLSDDPSVFDYASAAHFAQQDKIESATGVHLAHEWDETHSARFFAQAIQAIESMPENSLLWLHSRGLHNPWDAPYAYREQFVDEEDPNATGSAQVPSLQLDEDYDPDTLHEIQCAYAGQIVLIDQCLAVLQSIVREKTAQQEMLFMVSSPGGFPLGEHLSVGRHAPNVLYHESLSVPGLVRYPDGRLAMKRRGRLAKFTDLADCLNDWLTHHRTKTEWGERTHSVCHSGDQCLLRTPVWHVKFPQLTDDQEADVRSAELYLKPDDQNEVNDVSDRCEAVVEAGREFLLKLQETSSAMQPTPAILLEPLE